LSLALIPVWRRYAPKVERPSEAPLLNRRAESYIGRTFTLENPIVDGIGRVRIDDTIWRVSGPDSPAGSQVRIVRAQGPNLFVERV
jgi:inner membrane protein